MNSYDPSVVNVGDIEQQLQPELHVEDMVRQPKAVPVQVPGTETREDMEVDTVPASTRTEADNIQSMSIQLLGPVLDTGTPALETETGETATDMPDLIS